jgi:alpha-galactosidase
MERWQISNRAIAQAIALDDEGHLRCRSLVDRASRREWMHPSRASDEFLLEVASVGAAGPATTLTGDSGWDLLGAERSAAKGWKILEVRLVARAHPLEVRRTWAVHATLPVIRQWTTVANTGTAPLVLRRIDSFRLRLAPTADDLELSWLNNYCRGLKPSPAHPVHRRTVGTNIRHHVETGPYSPDCAWFTLEIPDASAGLTGGWEWSGPVKVGFGDWEGPCLVNGGLDPEGMEELLAPGASFRAPAGWYGFHTGGIEGAARLAAAFTVAVSDCTPPRHDWPWLGYCTWSDALDGEKSPFVEKGSNPWFPSEANVLSQVEAAAEAGFDHFILDYGWFPRVGDWWCDLDRFPGGPKRIARAVKDHGMRLGIWMGFGSTDPAATVAREHPDWLATYGGKPIPDAFPIRCSAQVWNTRVLCLGHRPVVDWIVEQATRVVEEFELDWFKHDFDTLTLCRSADHTHTPGDGRIAGTEGYYGILDTLHRRFPDLILDNWESDSALPDHGMMARHHVHLIGDTYSSFLLRQMFYGASRLFPHDRLHRYLRLEDSDVDMRTALRSAMIGGPLTMLSDPRKWSSSRRRVFAREMSLHRRVRELFRDGRMHALLGRPTERGWDAFQFQAGPRGVIYVFRNGSPDEEVRLRPRDLAPAARWRIVDTDTGGVRTATGARLTRDGIAVRLPRGGSGVLEIARAEKS